MKGGGFSWTGTQSWSWKPEKRWRSISQVFAGASRSFYNFGRTAPRWMDCCLASCPKSVIGVYLCAEGPAPMVGFLPSAGNSLGTSFTPWPPLAALLVVQGAITESVSSIHRACSSCWSPWSQWRRPRWRPRRRCSQPGEAAVLGLVGDGPAAVEDRLHDVAVQLVSQLRQSWDQLLTNLHSGVGCSLGGWRRRLEK